MSSRTRQRDRAIIDRYTDQPNRLPAELRADLERAFGSVQLYAFIDLAPSLKLAESWLALGSSHVALASRDGSGWKLAVVDRAQVREVRVASGLTCHVLRLLGAPDEPPLLVIHYTHRQRKAVEAIRVTLEQSLSGAMAWVGGEGADDRYADAVAGPVREAQALVGASDTAIVLRLLRYLRPYRRQVAIGMGAAVLVTLLGLVPPYLAGYLVDRVARPAQDGRLSREAAGDIALICVSAMAAIFLLREMFAWVRLRVMAFLGEYVARDLRSEIYQHLQAMSLSFFSRKKTGSLISRITSDTERVWEFITSGIVDVSLALVTMIGIGVILITLDWRLGLVMIAPVPILCAFILAYGRLLERYFLRAWRKWSQLTDIVSDTIPGIRVVKAFNQETSERRRFALSNEAATSQFNQAHAMWTRCWPVLMVGIHGLTVAVWFLALPRLLGSSAPELSTGTFVSFLLYATMFAAPIEVIGRVTRVMNRATSSAQHIFEVLDSEPEVVEVPEPVRLEPVRGHVVFDDVSFGYDPVRLVLKRLSFEIAPGEMIGLVGPSGAGKTTIANLIARFYDPALGAVCIDGIDLRTLELGVYRRQIGMVLQEPYLFHGTIGENICYGLPDAGFDRVLAAARAANAHDFICRLPHAYDTMVGERGHTLSGGERQRISIARALLHDPRILILDEATSSVDSETERAIDEAIQRLVAGRTVLVIAHRLSTLRRATRLLVVEDGQITESGTHAELMGNSGSTYRRLVELQREAQRTI